MNESQYEIIIYWDKQDKIFIAEVPELSGCMSHGSTKTEALSNAEEAVSLWLESAVEDGIPIPEPRGKLMFA